MPTQTNKRSIDLNTATLSELGQVPMMQWIDLWYRIVQLIGSAICAGIGTDSYAIGLSVLLGLSVVLNAIDNSKSN